MATPVIDLLSGELFGERARETYAWMRDHSPVHRDVNGLWGVSRYADLVRVAKDPASFSNAGGSRPNTGPLPWMIDLDPPEHAKRRKLVSKAFAPGRVRASEPHIARICDELLDTVCERGECDLVRDLAAPLPLIVIGDMLGVAPGDRGDLLRWSDGMLSSLSGDPDDLERAAVAFGEYTDYAGRVIAARREDPTDDLVSVLVHAEVDGERLTEDEIVFESLLILVGGDETTRHVISGGTEQLLANENEHRKLRDDPGRLAAAIEEMLRWVSPIKNMARTATRDLELCGEQVPAGAKLLLLYESANFDERQFAEPQRFTIDRVPNDHLAFGFGPHFCLGASLARVELTAMFERLLRRLPDLRLATEAPLPRFLGAIESMPVSFSPSAPVLDERR